MALDFPTSPSVGQTYTSGGMVWQWDGAKWVNGTGLAAYAPIASPVFTGDPQVPQPPVGDSDTSIATTAFVQAAVATANHNVGRNLLHNPLFNVAQRGAGPWTASGYTSDRWIAAQTLDAISSTVAILNDAARTAIGDEAAGVCLSNTFTGNAGATAISYLDQRLEGTRRMGGKTVTLSFWASASAALRIGINFYQAFGTGGSPSAVVQVLATGTAITLSTTWTRYSTTVLIPSTVGKTTGTNNDDITILRFHYSSGANNAAAAGNIGVQSGTIQLWGVQLEIGSVATPLEKPDPRYDLANCQRFYQSGGQVVVGGYGSSTTYVPIFLPVQMRALPTATIPTPSLVNFSSPSIAAAGTGGQLTLAGAVTSLGSWSFNGGYTASADL